MAYAVNTTLPATLPARRSASAAATSSSGRVWIGISGMPETTLYRLVQHHAESFVARTEASSSAALGLQL